MGKLQAFGVGGAVLTGLCCVTPLLPWTFSALGLTGLLGYFYRDDVLYTALAGFLLLTGYAIWRRKKNP